MKKSSGPRALSGVGRVTKTKKFGGKTYTKATCSRLKSDAKKNAESARASGKAARVVKGDGVWCLFTRGGTRVRQTRLKHGLAGRKRTRRRRS